MKEIITILFYIVLMAVSMYIVELAKKKADCRYLLIPVILLSFVAGCRSFEVGTDTMRVVESIEYTYREGIFVHSKEYLYYFICNLVMHIWENPSIALFVLSFLTNWLVIFRIWDFRKKIVISFSMAMYFMFYYGMSMNIARQCLAIAVVFYATRYLEKRDYKKYIIGVTIAFLIHISSIVAIAFPVIRLVTGGNVTKKTWKIIGYICLAAILPFAFMIYRYSEYFTEITIDIGLMQSVWIALILFSFLVLQPKKKGLLSVNSIRAKRMYLTEIFLYTFIGAFSALVGYIIPWAGRIGYTFKIFEIIYLGMIMRRRDYDNRLKLVLMVCFYVLGIYTLMTYSAIVPYAFVW